MPVRQLHSATRMREESEGSRRRTVTYCLVPWELAAKLHEPLRRHFRDDPTVEVVVERRARDRRAAGDRRVVPAADLPEEQRLIRNAGGRRIADRRASGLPVTPPPLPRRFRAHEARVVWVQRAQPSDEQLEDADTARLVTRIQAGDREAFAGLYMRYFDRVFSYLKLMFRDDPHEAEDITQQVFTKLIEALPRYERRTQPFRGWLFVIVRNEALQRLAVRGRSDVLEPEELARRQEDPDGDPEAALGELRWITDRELLMFVERLPLAQRQVLLLRHMLDLPATEVARILGRTPVDVRALDYRARRYLSTRLAAVGRAPTCGERKPLQSIPRRRWLPVSSRQRRYALTR